MTFKPILFNTEMVKAILEGKKTQTRRKVKFNKNITNYEVGFTTFCEIGEFAVRGIHENGEFGESFFKLPIATGDILWVRETFREEEFPENSGVYDYLADYYYKKNYIGKGLWKPSIHMPKKACRLFLEVTNIRVEQLKRIKTKDAIAEGVKYSKEELAVPNFLSLWTSVYGEQSLKDNPFVFIVEFKVIDKPEEFNNQ